MGWSYRSDRSDEVYAKTSGPAAAVTEQMPRPPADGEDVDNVLNPPVAEEKELQKKIDEARPVDPEAGPKPPPDLSGVPQEVIQEHKLGPAPAPSVEDQQKAIDEARGSSTEQKKPETPSPAAAKK